MATEHLDLMNKKDPHPWTLTFSYGRALQDEPCVRKGAADNTAEAQKVASRRAKLTSAAANGTYEREMETAEAVAPR